MYFKNILHITGQYTTNRIGGLERWYINNSIILKDCKIYLLYFGQPENSIISEYENNGINIIVLKNKNIFNFIKILKKYKIDIVHAHFENTIDFLLISKLFFRKTFWHMHMGNYYFHNNKWKSNIKLFLGLKFYNFKLFIKQLFIDKIFFVSEGALIENKAIHTYTNSKLKVFYLGVDDNLKQKYRNKEYIDNSSPITITCIAFQNHIKGIDILIESCRILKEKKYDFIINLVGGTLDNKVVDKNYYQLVKKYNLEENFLFLGSQKNVFKYLEKSHIYCQTSRSESLSLSIMEAMIVGLPVVATNVGGIPELVTHHKNGFLFQNEDYKECAMYLEKLILDEDLRKRMSLESKTIIDNKKFSTENNINDIKKYYL